MSNNPCSHMQPMHYFWSNGKNYVNKATGWGRYEETNNLPFINQCLSYEDIDHESNEESFEEEYSYHLPRKINPYLAAEYAAGISARDMDCDEFEDY